MTRHPSVRSSAVDTMTTMADSDTMQVNSEAGTMIINDSDDDGDADDATMKSRSSTSCISSLKIHKTKLVQHSRVIINLTTKM